MGSVLVLAPHPDDESIGCGGALRQHCLDGDRVSVAFLTSGDGGIADLPPAAAAVRREQEAERAAAVLGLSELHFLRFPDGRLAEGVADAAAHVGSLITSEQPEWIYLPHPGEAHDDHRVTALIAAAALPRDVEWLIRGYEIWTPIAQPHEMDDISDVMATKLEAIRCYESQVEQLPYERAALALNGYRGALFAGCEYAEAFTYLDHEALESA
jgi:LmbE family N-acetylglucosaminyl deacetylase